MIRLMSTYQRKKRKEDYEVSLEALQKIGDEIAIKKITSTVIIADEVHLSTDEYGSLEHVNTPSSSDLTVRSHSA